MEGKPFASNVLESGEPSRFQFLRRWIPKGVISQTVFWALLPFASLLATIGVASLTPSPLFPLFVAIVSICSLVSFQGKLSSLCGSLALLTLTLFFQLKQGGEEESLWYSGIYLASILTSTLFLLSRKEIVATLSPLLVKISEKEKLFEKLEHTLEVSREEWRRKEESFEEKRESAEREISHLLKKHELQAKKMELVEEEIELLTSQKEEILAQAISHVPSGAIPPLHSPSEEELQRECAKLQGLNEQLRLQFEEKKELLAEARQALFFAQEKGEKLEKESLFASLEAESEEMRAWQKEWADRGEEILRLTEEVTILEELISRVHSQ